MRNKKKFLIYTGGTDGGTGSLSIRLMSWFKKNNYDCVYMCNEINNIKNADRIRDIAHEFYDYSNMKKKDVEKKIIELNQIETVITYDVKSFIKLFINRRKYKIINIYLYVVHPKTLTKGTMLSRKVGKSLIKLLTVFFYKKLIIALYNNNYLFFMDEDCIKNTEKYFNYTFRNISNKLIRLPIIINPQEDVDYRKGEICRILTISRFDFPFKGYILGLIKDFEYLCSKYNCELTIIGDGKDKQKLLNEISKLDSSVAHKINLLENIEYEELNKYFDNSDLYIGMGTSILDAVNNSKPSLVVNYFTYSNISTGFFHNNPTILGDEKNGELAINYIIKFLNMNNNEISQLIKKQHSLLSLNYDIESNILKIIEFDNKQDDQFASKVMYFKILSIFIMNNIRY